MRWARAVAAPLGIAGLLTAWAVGAGAIEGLLPLAPAVRLLGNDYFLVVGLAAVATAVAVPALASGRPGNLARAEMPDPEEPVSGAVPGDRFDRKTGGWGSLLPVIGARRRRAVETRLRGATVDVVARSEACSRAEAERRVERGEWTDDPVAAAFVAHSAATTSTPGDRVRSIVDGEGPLRRQARRTVDALAAYDSRAAAVTDGGRDGD